MLTPPAISADTIIAHVRESYRLGIRRVTFLPIGADANAAVYRVEAEDGKPYFLKLKRGTFDDVAVAISAFLHARGIRHVMAPIETATHGLWARGHGFAWMLYPFFEGTNGFETPLSDAQWVTLGRSLKAVHSVVLPPELGQKVPREAYSSQWRDMVEGFDHEIGTHGYDDPIAARLAAFWIAQREEICTMVARAAQLAGTLRNGPETFVLCHSDLHAWNVLVGDDDELAIVDWDEPILASKERDLMFVGGGVGGVWNDAREEALFFQGYGAAEIDSIALAYYRYERIVADLAAYGTQIFGAWDSVEDREEGLQQVMGQFLPDNVVDIAHRTYRSALLTTT
jgi:spectinomycin phosphotransferase